MIVGSINEDRKIESRVAITPDILKKGALSYQIDNVKLNISTLVTEVSKLYGGGASKDPNLSIGGGPNNYKTSDALKLAKELILKDK